MDWAVGCHLGRGKTIEKVSSRFYWRNNSKSGNEYQEGTGKDNGKKIVCMSYLRKHYTGSIFNQCSQ